MFIIIKIMNLETETV